ncbi:hypothetical protein Ddye_028162 [Dipteronia dyeriana]|uniref:RNase H type-1 domain-containing protein n=1 Tax=Dipteronia dyeriana TaxID=168575 RepID=A0AAD9WS37_9ROSI|nr:hypothetical protein Ddye_028162 [Dipteronia dyeriana]
MVFQGSQPCYELCFNVDGSSRGNPGDSGIGGMLTDSNGKVICLFLLGVGVVDSVTAEVLVILKACELIHYNPRSVGRVINIFSDSKSAISWVNGNDFDNFKLVWILPRGDELCFNVDGSSRGNSGDFGIGGMLTDSNGKVLCLFSLGVGVVDSVTAEVLVVLKACELIHSNPRLVGRVFNIFSDSKSAISWVNGNDFDNFKLVNQIYDVISFLKIVDGLSISFKSRGSNSFTNSLTRDASDNGGDKIVLSDF